MRKGSGKQMFSRGGRIGKTEGFPEVRDPGRRRPTGQVVVAQKFIRILCVTTGESINILIIQMAYKLFSCRPYW